MAIITDTGVSEGPDDNGVMALLGAGIPLSLLMDLVDAEGPQSRDLITARRHALGAEQGDRCRQCVPGGADRAVHPEELVPGRAGSAGQIGGAVIVDDPGRPVASDLGDGHPVILPCAARSRAAGGRIGAVSAIDRLRRVTKGSGRSQGQPRNGACLVNHLASVLTLCLGHWTDIA